MIFIMGCFYFRKTN